MGCELGGETQQERVPQFAHPPHLERHFPGLAVAVGVQSPVIAVGKEHVGAGKIDKLIRVR